MEKQLVRDSRFELLRIMAMILIVAFHLVNPMNATRNLYPSDCHILTLFGSWGCFSVDLFVLISCFFFFNKEHYNASNIDKIKIIWNKRVKKILIQTLSYIFFLTLLIPILKDETADIAFFFFLSGLIKDPLFISFYWFVSAYIGLQFALPYIQRIQVSKELFVVVNVLLFISNEQSKYGFITDTIHFVLVALFLLHIMKIEGLNRFVKKKALFGFILTTGILLTATALPNRLAEKNAGHLTLFLIDIIRSIFNFDRFSYFLVIDSVFFFYLFQRLKPFSSRVINYFSSLMFGVYLFHQFPGYSFATASIDILSPILCSNNMIFVVATFSLTIFGTCIETIRKLIICIIYRTSRS